MTSVVSEYIRILNDYAKLYGEDIVVLMQVGSFYEVYGVDNETEKIGNVAEVSRLLNMVLTRRNKSVQKNSRSNPLMLGFPCLALSKHIPTLLEEDYTIVVVDQVKTGLSIRRAVREVISPSTYIDGNNDEYMVLVYTDRTGECFHIGLSAINVITGRSVVHECHSAPGDLQKPLDDAASFVQRYRPREVVLASNSEEWSSFKELQVKLGYRAVNKMASNVAYQNEVLGSVFDNRTMLSNIEYVDLECRQYALVSYVLLIEYVHEHNPLLIRRMSMPEICVPQEHLVLATNTIEQLNLVPNTPARSRKITSVFSVINNCSTSVGKRMLKDRLLSPVFDPNKLEARYKQVEGFGSAVEFGSAKFKAVERLMLKVADIEKLQRRMSLSIMSPSELASMHSSYRIVLELHREIAREGTALGGLMLTDDDILLVKEFIGECEKVFNVDQLLSHDMDNGTTLTSVFREGASDKIDKLEAAIRGHVATLNNVANELSSYLGGTDLVRVEHSQASGYCLVVTNNRAKRLLSKFKELSFNQGKTGTKITSQSIHASSRAILGLTERLHTFAKECYKYVLQELHCMYGLLFSRVTRVVADLDVTKSNYKTSVLYGYCRPEVVEDERSFIRAHGLRHPIIERIDPGTEYVANDLEIGTKHNGMVLYSMNSGGKTSLLKALGISIVLAQMGSFVPATNYAFCPFSTVMTRIVSEDSVLKGRSSFVAEMSELRSILKRADTSTLVLADEITHGTEHTSGSAIFTSSVITLAERRANFMFTTHLHNVHPFIKDVKNVRVCHLSVAIRNGTVIFERKLLDGPCDSLYGLEVCGSLNMDTEFLARAFMIRDVIEGNKRAPTAGPLKIVKSKYNKDKMVQTCQVCNYSPRQKTDMPLDVHHINQRCLSNGAGLIVKQESGDVLHKNTRSNLVVLCKECHAKAHNGSIIINGYLSTSNGIMLNVHN